MNKIRNKYINKDILFYINQVITKNKIDINEDTSEDLVSIESFYMFKRAINNKTCMQIKEFESIKHYTLETLASEEVFIDETLLEYTNFEKYFLDNYLSNQDNNLYLLNNKIYEITII